ncbi:serine/threonine-protein phosphatase [Candidatus Poribacteria bacterium]|nr:serine/threonine-protein phosphatase [Candidatus Poribacteria bacterium]
MSDIAIVVGDVTGHGMQAAMNAMMTNGILHAVAKGLHHLSPTALLLGLNDALKGRMERGMNVTMVTGTLNAGGGSAGVSPSLTLANAAHHAHPLLFRNGEVHPLVCKGMPLGMMAGIRYREVEFPLQSGDVLVFMTDGIIEVTDPDGTDYADSGRLQQTLAHLPTEMSAQAMVDALLTDAMGFSGEKSERDDDMTVVVAKIL